MIREATLNDIPTLAPLYQALADAFRTTGPGHLYTEAAVPMRLQYYEQILREGAGRIFVAEARDQVIGMIVCEYREADAAFRWRRMVIVQDLWVVPAHRQGGIARRLCDTAFARCASDGREIVYIWIAATNAVMLEQSAAWDFHDEYVIKTKLLK